MRLGNFPGVPAEQARKLALTVAADVAKGIDVQARKKESQVEVARQRASTLRLFLDDGDIRQIPVAFREIESIADDELVLDAEADVVHDHGDLAP